MSIEREVWLLYTSLYSLMIQKYILHSFHSLHTCIIVLQASDYIYVSSHNREVLKIVNIWKCWRSLWTKRTQSLWRHLPFPSWTSFLPSYWFRQAMILPTLIPTLERWMQQSTGVKLRLFIHETTRRWHEKCHTYSITQVRTVKCMYFQYPA